MAKTIKMKNPVHTEMVDTFHKWYMAKKALPFVWTPKEMAQIDLVYKNLVQLCHATGSASDNDSILILWAKMLSGLQTVNQWVYQNASPSMINCKFNEIVCALRNGNPVPKQPEYVQTKISIIEEMFK